MRKYQIQTIFNGMAQKFNLTYPQYQIYSNIQFVNNVYFLNIGGFENTQLSDHFNLYNLLKSNNQQFVALALLRNTLSVLYNFKDDKFKQQQAAKWMQGITKEQFIQQKDQMEKYINQLTKLNQVYFKNQSHDIQQFLNQTGY